ncbi:hypothetical protein [Pontibacter arcticus]|uniref:DUF3221 domain-containing protein n=1 Tax=Pontibacter arcticus TaxID=2080288 RepID=A0A364RDH8_9BACT|nr:hypothetical protein [Pontibacter arcticus]RAU82329.1 hypothetical protein DP923_11105 [Pontibacter arcticus]
MTYRNDLRLIATLAFSVAILTAGCRGEEPKRMPDTIPEAHGYLTNIKRTSPKNNKESATLLVAPLDSVEAKYTRASIKIDQNTLIETATGKPMKIENLREGHEIEAWFIGDVQESDPVTAQAKALRVIE